MSAGELRLVEDFEELGPGIRVEILCDCGARHRTMVIGHARFARAVTRDHEVPLFTNLVPVLPPWPCTTPSEPSAVCAELVELRRVWRRLDYDPASADERRDRLDLAGENLGAVTRAVLVRSGIRVPPARNSPGVPDPTKARWSCLRCFVRFASADPGRLRHYVLRHEMRHFHLGHVEPEWKDVPARDAALARLKVAPRACEFDLDDAVVRAGVTRSLDARLLY